MSHRYLLTSGGVGGGGGGAVLVVGFETRYHLRRIGPLSYCWAIRHPSKLKHKAFHSPYFNMITENLKDKNTRISINYTINYIVLACVKKHK